MKHIENQDYYQILEVPYKASWGEIQKAYELAKMTYNKGSMATYSLFDFNERGRILDKIEEAYHVLSHPEKRVKYDHALETLIPAMAAMPVRVDAPVPSLASVAPPAPAGHVAPAEVFTLSPASPVAAAATEITTSAEVMVHVLETEVVSGKTLKALREKQGVTLDDIADKTRINLNYLEYIESDSYGSLPAPVYIMGYLKQYAKISGIDSAIMEEYMKSYQRWADAPKKIERYR